MKKKKDMLPPPYVAETKDMRFEGTYEVLVPVPGRNKPHKAAGEFDSEQAANAWLHSSEGQDTIARILREVG